MEINRIPRSVIEHKLLCALNDSNDKVAILATRQDLEVLMTALVVYARAKETTAPHSQMAHELAMGIRQLLREAFSVKSP